MGSYKEVSFFVAHYIFLVIVVSLLAIHYLYNQVELKEFQELVLICRQQVETRRELCEKLEQYLL